MYICDTHTHSNHSPDVPPARVDSIDALCRAAVSRGVRYLAITDHYEPDGIAAGRYPPYPFAAIADEVNACREAYGDSLYVALGIEYGEPFHAPDGILPTLRAYPYDITLASLHCIPGKPSFASLDYSRISMQDAAALMEQYLDCWDALTACPDFDVYTHPSYPLRYLLRAGIPYPTRLWEERMRASFKVIISRGAALEYNTSTMRSPNAGIPDHTAETILRWYRDCGGENVTYASDAHDPADVAAHYSDALHILRELGFRYLTVYRQRRPDRIRIDTLI